jgi:hypothetical protein
MACIPCGQRANARTNWSVDLAPIGQSFKDGTTSKTFALASEANAAIQSLNLVGKVRPKPVPA